MSKTTTLNVSPKVLTGLLVGLGVAALTGIVGAVTPHTFDFLGPWAVFASAGFSVIVGQALAWLKREQAREAAEEVTVVNPEPVAPAAPAAPTAEVTAAAAE